MKRLLAITLFAVACPTAASSDSMLGARFDDTALCYPASYDPGTTFMDAVLASIEDQLDDSSGERLIYVPAEKIRELVPTYTENHTNDFGAVVAHDVMGIAYPLTSISDPDHMAKQAWNVRAGIESYFVEPDPDLPYFRIYPFKEPYSSWSLVKSPPPESPVTDPPKDWYIANCTERLGNWSCRQVATYRSVYYKYRIHQQDFQVREEVRDAVTELLRGWHQNCEFE